MQISQKACARLTITSVSSALTKTQVLPCSKMLREQLCTLQSVCTAHALHHTDSMAHGHDWVRLHFVKGSWLV